MDREVADPGDQEQVDRHNHRPYEAVEEGHREVAVDHQAEAGRHTLRHIHREAEAGRVLHLVGPEVRGQVVGHDHREDQGAEHGREDREGAPALGLVGLPGPCGHQVEGGAGRDFVDRHSLPFHLVSWQQLQTLGRPFPLRSCG